MQLTASTAPHVHHRDRTATLMLDVITALVPSAAAGIWLFGWNAARVILLSTVFCVLLEMIWQKLTKKPIRINDFSAAVTGIILALNLPPTAPWWMILIGAAVAIVLVKQMFGGIGCNFVNPALATRAVLLTSWPTLMAASNTSSAYVTPFDGVTSATLLTPGNGLNVSMIDMLLGRIPGTIGEVCKVAILIGFVYLLIRRTITWHIPVVMLASFAAFSAIFGQNPVTALLTGGIMFGAVFMATDYVTSPMTHAGQAIYAAGAGLIVALIRSFGGYPEGVTYGILLMNLATPLIDRAIRPRIYGEVKAHE
ncbi:MAG: RnfABCDGE type electron transport complex subunit D [Clostridia bacterium]|nr:RnfABCDGE type electron transport complex subunit D [Clostridia bacterium]